MFEFIIFIFSFSPLVFTNGGLIQNTHKKKNIADATVVFMILLDQVVF